MLLEGNVGCDASLLANAADIASANARAQNSLSAAGASVVTAAVPSNLTAPSSVVLAACLVTLPAQVADFSFDFYFTDSAADTITVAIQEITHATAIAGGAATGTGWRIENGGTPITVTGDAPVTIETLTKSVTTGGLSDSFNVRFVELAPGTVGFQIVVSAAHNLSAMVFNGVALQA
jgi:hypothetical protein